MKPLKISILLLAGSVALTALLWIIGLPFFFVILIIPLIPFFTGKKEIRHCPVCGWETTGSERLCPYDATPLEPVQSRQG